MAIGVQIDRTRTKFTGEDVLRPLWRKKVRGMFQFGSFVRTTARRSMRKAGKNPRKPSYTSRPGEPPRRHPPNDWLYRALKFAVNRDVPMVTMGPSYRSTRFKDVPRLLAEGGSASRRLLVIDESDRVLPARTARGVGNPAFALGGPGVPQTRIRVQARPYMRPAFEIGQSKLARFFGERR